MTDKRALDQIFLSPDPKALLIRPPDSYCSQGSACSGQRQFVVRRTVLGTISVAEAVILWTKVLRTFTQFVRQKLEMLGVASPSWTKHVQRL